MAKKKQDPKAQDNPVEEKATNEESFNHEDVADKSFEEIAAEATQDEEKPQEPTEDPVEEPQETPQEEPQEDPVEPEQPQVDIEAEREKARADALKEVTDKIVASLKGPEAQEGDPVDEELVSPWDKEGRNPKSYAEIAEWSADLLQIKNERAAKEQAQREAEEREAQTKAEEEARERANSYIDNQLSELESSGKLPKILTKEPAATPESETDPGRRARRHLFETWARVNQERTSKGLPPVTSVKEIYYEHYQPDVVPGADAPISGAGSPASDAGNTSFAYEEIQNASFDDLLSGN